MKSVFSPPGTYIPGKNITLGIGTIRGVESRGMLCSAAELQISEDHDGIIDLPADAPVGAGLRRNGPGSTIPCIEIKLTPNRADAPACTASRAISPPPTWASSRPPAIKPVKGEFPCPVQGDARFRSDADAVPGLRAAAGARRQERPVAGMAADSA